MSVVSGCYYWRVAGAGVAAARCLVSGSADSGDSEDSEA